MQRQRQPQKAVEKQRKAFTTTGVSLSRYQLRNIVFIFYSFISCVCILSQKIRSLLNQLYKILSHTEVRSQKN
jgi:hypothetical protein